MISPQFRGFPPTYAYTFVTLWRKITKFGAVTHTGERCDFQGSATPPSQGSWATSRPNFWGPRLPCTLTYLPCIYGHTLCCRSTKVGILTHVRDGRVFSRGHVAYAIVYIAHASRVLSPMLSIYHASARNARRGAVSFLPLSFRLSASKGKGKGKGIDWEFSTWTFKIQ